MHFREGSSWKLLKLRTFAKERVLYRENCPLHLHDPSSVSSRKTFQAQMLARRWAVGRKGTVLAVPFQLWHCTHLLPMAAHKWGRWETWTSPAYIKSQ